MNRHPSVAVEHSETLFTGPVFDLVRERIVLPSGRRQDLSIVDHPGAVAIAPLQASGELVLVRQYRHATGDWQLELPAGRLEPGEEPLTAAQRELEEETGYRAARWTPLRSVFAAPGFCSEELHLFLARDLEAVAGGGLAPDDDEEIECVPLPPAALLQHPACRDAKTLLVAALLLAGLTESSAQALTR